VVLLLESSLFSGLIIITLPLSGLLLGGVCFLSGLLLEAVWFLEAVLHLESGQSFSRAVLLLESGFASQKFQRGTSNASA